MAAAPAWLAHPLGELWTLAMCGFAGLIDPHCTAPDRLARAAERMIAPIAHRGPDDAGVHVEAVAGLALGFRRLAVLEPGPAGHQPMISASGRSVLVFNGEIYNAAALRRLLAEEGQHFRGRSDTEVLLEACERWGVAEALRRAVGMFALAFWDRTRRDLVLARDRLGKKPLFYGVGGGRFFFASQPKSLLALEGVERRIDREALRLYLRHGYVPAPHAIFAGLRKLPAGAIGRWRQGGELLIERYWSPAEAAAAPPLELAPEAAVDALETLLGETVACRLHADVPLGAFLSGGVDSSLIVALMQRASGGAVETFSIGFEDPALDEAPMARRVAAHLGTRHHELYVGSAEALAGVPQLPEWFDEPFADYSALPTLLLCRFARRGVTVALSGDGGDELFAGYRRYAQTLALKRRLDRLPRAALPLARALGTVPDAAWEGAGRLLPAALEGARLGERARRLAALAGASPQAVMDDMTSHWPEPARLLREDRPAGRRRKPAPSGTAPLAGLRLHDLERWLADDILVKVDRASMAASLEVRAPLLDHRMVELALRLPLPLLQRDGRGKWPLRQLLGRHLPSTLIDRPKQGFAPPVQQWLRGPLRDWAEDLLEPARLDADGLFDTGLVRRIWRQHLEGRVDRRFPLWNLLMLQAWKQRWLAPAGGGAHSCSAVAP
ncbi:asparagine synthase (glutamine-hydrolyzing) [Geminicoccaceae bacterium 1502E]|nr:asparagine synthase (glutamine-hydrolyzing) [Geminicoccaceae bacterium 1502E]